MKRYFEVALVVILLLTYGAIRYETVKNKPITFDETLMRPMVTASNAQHIDTEIEDPPLGRVGMIIGWRDVSIVMGCLSLAGFYIINRKLKIGIVPALISTTALSLSTLVWWFSGHAMIDIYEFAFAIWGMVAYLCLKPVKSGVLMGLSTCSKLMGALGVLSLIILDSWTNGLKNLKKLIISSIAGFLVSYEVCESIILHRVANPITSIYGMFHKMFYAYGINPTWKPAFMWFIHWGQAVIPDGTYLNINYYAWLLVWPLMLYAGYKAWKGDLAGRVVISWFIGFYVSIGFVLLALQRTSSYYYELMVIPAFYLAFAMVLQQIWPKPRLRLATIKK